MLVSNFKLYSILSHFLSLHSNFYKLNLLLKNMRVLFIFKSKDGFFRIIQKVVANKRDYSSTFRKLKNYIFFEYFKNIPRVCFIKELENSSILTEKHILEYNFKNGSKQNDILAECSSVYDISYRSKFSTRDRRSYKRNESRSQYNLNVNKIRFFFFK